jgi:hypothetical protein
VFLVSGFWFLVSGYWLLVTGCWLLVAGRWMLVAGYWLLVLGLASLSSLRSILVSCFGFLVLILQSDIRHP